MSAEQLSIEEKPNGFTPDAYTYTIEGGDVPAGTTLRGWHAASAGRVGDQSRDIRRSLTVVEGPFDKTPSDGFRPPRADHTRVEVVGQPGVVLDPEQRRDAIARVADFALSEIKHRSE